MKNEMMFGNCIVQYACLRVIPKVSVCAIAQVFLLYPLGSSCSLVLQVSG